MGTYCVVATISVVFLLAVLLLLMRECYYAVSCRGWPSVKGRILANTVGRIGGDGRTWACSIKYEYIVGEQKLKSRRIAFLRWWGSENYASETAHRFSHRAEQRVYHHPDKPGLAVLDRGLRIMEFALTAVAATILILGIGVGGNIAMECLLHL
jgi:hypothetical protein